MKVAVRGSTSITEATASAMDVLEALHSEQGVTKLIEFRANGLDNIAWMWARSEIGLGSIFSVSRWHYNLPSRARYMCENSFMFKNIRPDIIILDGRNFYQQSMIDTADKEGVKVIVTNG